METPQYLYKILSIENWTASQNLQTIQLSSGDAQFIHLATASQLDRIIEKYWGEAAKYVILKVDVNKLSGRLVLESNPGGETKYYHLYSGSIPKNSVVEIQLIEKSS